MNKYMEGQILIKKTNIGVYSIGSIDSTGDESIYTLNNMINEDEPVATVTESKVDEEYDVVSIETKGPTTTDEHVDEPRILGDINGDGCIDRVDVMMALTIFSDDQTGNRPAATEEQKKAADVNGDGVINASDASDIIGYVMYLKSGGDLSLQEYLELPNEDEEEVSE